MPLPVAIVAAMIDADTPLEALAAQVVLPVLDLRKAEALPGVWEAARRLAARGVGGFILFGGDRRTLGRELADLRALAPRGLLVSADLERGLGQQVHGGAHQPPLLALGAAGDERLARAAARAVAEDALEVGVDWVLGPVLDLADEPRNPIVGTRSLGADPARVAALGAAIIEGIQAAGALACAKHYPGHGATTDDSHAALPVVTRAREALLERDLRPFRAAVEAGVASIMTAHVAYPTLSDAGKDVPCTLDPGLVRGLLRQGLGFDGLVVTDALIMDGALLAAGDELGAACRALEAGADALLYPKAPDAVIDRVAAWAAAAPGRAARLREAAGRVMAAKARVRRAPRAPFDGGPHVDPGEAVAAAALTRLGEARPALRRGEAAGLVVLDDDALPGLGHEVVAALTEAGVELSPAVVGPDAPPAAVERARAVAAGAAARGERLVVVVGCRVRAWKGRPGLAPGLLELLRSLPAARTTVVALCGPAPLRGALPAGAELLVGWGDEPAVQAAAARALLGGPAPGRLPVPDPREP